MNAETQDPSSGQSTSSDQPRGLLDSLKTLVATLLAMGRTRLELLSVEFEEERVRLGAILIWTFVALFCAALGVVLFTLLLVVIFWDTNRLLALGVLALFFLLAALLCARIALDKARAKPRLFATSLAELSTDREQLTPDVDSRS